MSYQTLMSGQEPPLSFLGVIEGYYGKGWSWEARQGYMQWLPRHGYGFYIYAPKNDDYLRKNWFEPWPADQLAVLIKLAQQCRDNGLAFGVGLSPLGVSNDYDAKRPVLLEKLRVINEALKPDIQAILFDDMKGDVPELAQRQITMTHDIAAHSSASRLVFCPSYYTLDPVLVKIFGPMPANYLTDLGKGLDKRIDVFWSGPKVCSTEYPPAHLEQVAGWLQRKPFLWDNYPVNDGTVSSGFLHLRAFENRPAELAQLVSGHASNPMKEAALSALPLATLPMSYRLGAQYDPVKALEASATAACGPQIAAMIQADLPLFQDVGLAKLSTEQQSQLKSRYQPFQAQPCVSEILAWLAGEYAFDPACLTG